MSNLENLINKAFDDKESINNNTTGEIREAVNNTLDQLDKGKIRVCEKIKNEWIVNQWIKQFYRFRLNDNEIIKVSHATWFDKVESKTANWTKDDHLEAGFRYVPDAAVENQLSLQKV